MNQQLLEIKANTKKQNIQCNSEFVIGLLKETHVSVHASIKTTSMFHRIEVSVLVTEDSSAFSKK